MWFPVLIVLALCAFAVALGWRRHKVRTRREWIDSYQLPPGLLQRVRQAYPALSDQQLRLVESGLRQFFRLSLAANQRAVAMPSQAVDELWHNFILYTRNYQQFCRRAFGHYLHHTPAVAMGGRRSQRESIRRAWHLACREEGINPAKPARLPLLFGMDALLAIPNGFVYQPDCRNATVAAAGSYCGADLGSDSGCASCSGGSSWFSGDGSDGGSADGGGDSASDGGSSCGSSCGGGGCGGGGD